MNKITLNKKPVRLRINGILCNVTNINAGAIIYPPEPIIPPSPTSEWIGVELPENLGTVSICYGNGQFLGVSSKGYRFYSTDGFNWKLDKVLSYSGWNNVLYGNDLYVCTNDTVVYYAYSKDGENWEYSKIEKSIQSPSATYGDGKFVSLATINGYGFYSNDGIIWYSLSYPYSSQERYGNIYDIAFGNGNFVAVTYAGTGIQHSKNGIDWTYIPIDFSGLKFDMLASRSVAYGNGRFVSVPYNQYVCIYSDDGENWVAYDLPEEYISNYVSMAFGDRYFVAISATTSIISEDGINWFELKMPDISAAWSRVTYGDGKFVALSTDGKAAVLYSSEIQNPTLSNRIGTARIGKARIAKEG